MLLDRTTGITCALALAGAALAAAPAAAACDPGERELRFHHVAAETGNARGEAALALAARVNAELDGRACMRVRARAEDHTDDTVAGALAEGRFEIGAASTAALGAVSPRFLVFDLPFLFEDIEAVLDFQASGTGRQLLDETAPAGVRGLGFLLDGFDQIAATRPVAAPADLEGVGFRTGGSELERATAAALGAEPVSVPEVEIAAALAEGRIAALSASWSAIRSAGIAGRAPQLTETNHAVQQYVLLVSGAAWEAMEPALREDLAAIAREVAHERNRLSFELNEAAKHMMLQSGLGIRRLGDAERTGWQRAMQEVWFGFGGEIGFDQISTALYVNAR